MLQAIVIALVFAILAAGLLWGFRRVQMSQRLAERMAREGTDGSFPPRSPGDSRRGSLGQWLWRAGFRTAEAPATFTVLSLIGAATAVLLLVVYYASGVERSMLRGLEEIPGGVGDVFLHFALLGPWLMAGALAGFPWLFVRGARRRRVAAIEQDLPVALDLMATLSESGLGFDATLQRLGETHLLGRPLVEEFRVFQADLLAGRTRIEVLRRLADRVDLPPLSTFVSALVQAEQQGMSLAEILRRQANDLRARRRERAQTFANTLPVKLMFPLIICFLPGIFVWTLGPVFIQLFKIVDVFLQGPV